MPRSSASGSSSQFTANSLLSTDSESGWTSFENFKDTIELLTFNAGYLLSRDTAKTKVRREVALMAFLIEFLTLVSFCFHPEFPWGPHTKQSLGIASTSLQLRLDEWGWSAALGAWFCGAGIILFFYIDLILRTLKIIKFRLGFRIQRYLFTLQGPLFIPLVSALLQPLSCNTETGNLDGFSGVRCWDTTTSAALSAFSIFFVALWALTNVFGAVLSTDANPRSLGFAATPHSKAELVVIMSKMSMLICATFFRHNTAFRAAVNFISALACCTTMVIFLPHFNSQVNKLRLSLFSTFWWASLICVCVMMAPEELNDTLLYIFVGGAPLFATLGWNIVSFRVKYADGRYIAAQCATAQTNKKNSKRRGQQHPHHHPNSEKSFTTTSDISNTHLLSSPKAIVDFSEMNDLTTVGSPTSGHGGDFVASPSNAVVAANAPIVPLPKKFFSDYEVELATRFATIRQEYEDEEGNMVEIPVSPEHIVLVRRIYAAGLKQFPKSVFLRLAHAFFLLFAADEEQESRAEFERVSSAYSNPPVTVRYLLFCWRQDLAKKSNRADEDDLDIASQLEFTRNFKNARKNHLEAVNNIKSLWRALLPKHVDISTLPLIMERIHRAENRADKFFKGLIEKFPKSPRVIRAYAMYVSDVKSKPEIALHYFNRAEQIEEDTAHERRDAILGGQQQGTTMGSGSSGGTDPQALPAAIMKTVQSQVIVKKEEIPSPAELSLSLDCEILTTNQSAVKLFSQISPGISFSPNGTTSFFDFLDESCAHSFARFPLDHHDSQDSQTGFSEFSTFLLVKDSYHPTKLTPLHCHGRFMPGSTGMFLTLSEAHRTRIGSAQVHGFDENAILTSWDLSISHTFGLKRPTTLDENGDEIEVKLNQHLPWVPLYLLAHSSLGYCPETIVQATSAEGEIMWATACGHLVSDESSSWEFFALSVSTASLSIEELNRSLPLQPLPPLPEVVSVVTSQSETQLQHHQFMDPKQMLMAGRASSEASLPHQGSNPDMARSISSGGTGSSSSSKRKARLKKNAMLNSRKKKGAVFILHRSILFALTAMLIFALASFITADQLMTRSQSVVNLTYDAFSLSSLVAQVVHSVRTVSLGGNGVPAAQAEIVEYCDTFETKLLQLFYSDEQNNDQELADSFYLPNVTVCPEGFDRPEADTTPACRHGMWSVARTFLFNSRMIGTLSTGDIRFQNLMNLDTYRWLTNYGPHRILDNFEEMEWRYTRMSQRALVQIKTILAVVQSLSIVVLIFLVFGLIQPSFKRTNKDRFESISLFPLIPKEHIQTLLKRKYFILEEEQVESESDSETEHMEQSATPSGQHQSDATKPGHPTSILHQASQQLQKSLESTNSSSNNANNDSFRKRTSFEHSEQTEAGQHHHSPPPGVRFADNEPQDNEGGLRKRKGAGSSKTVTAVKSSSSSTPRKSKTQRDDDTSASDGSNSDHTSGSNSGDQGMQSEEWKLGKAQRDNKSKAREDDRTDKANARRSKFDDQESARKDRTVTRAQQELARARHEKDRDDARVARLDLRNEAKARRAAREVNGRMRADEIRDMEAERKRDELEAEADRKEQADDERKYREERALADLNQQEDDQDRSKEQSAMDKSDETDKKNRDKEQKQNRDARRKDRAKQKKKKDQNMMVAMESPLVRALTRRYLLIVVLILIMLVLAIVLGVLAIDNVAVSVVKMKYSSARSSLSGAMRYFAREHAMNGTSFLQDDILARLDLLRKYQDALEFGSAELGVQRRQGFQAKRDNMLYGHTCFADCPAAGSLDYVLLVSGLSDLVRYYGDQLEAIAQQSQPSMTSEAYRFVQETGENSFRVGLQNATALFVEDAISQLTGSKTSSAGIVAATCFLIIFLYFASFRPILTYTREELKRTIQLLLLLPDAVLDIPEINRVLTEKAHEIFDQKDL